MSTAKQKASHAEPALEQRLDEALEETFPASDPIAVGTDTQRVAQPKEKAGATKERAHTPRSRHAS
ncbi:hypothetical protein GCM10027093_15340 [Paraburkholderia jirisanensis]